MKKIIFAFFIISVLFGCSSKKIIKDNPDFSDICDNPSLYEGHKLEADVNIIGWSGRNCNFHKNALSTAISRSDWITRENGFCLYVSGGQPKGIDLFNLPKSGIRIHLVSVVKISKDKVYLEFVDATIIN